MNMVDNLKQFENLLLMFVLSVRFRLTIPNHGRYGLMHFQVKTLLKVRDV